MYKAIIVDDENRSVETLRIILQQFCSNEIEIVGTANSIDEAYTLIQTVAPHIVFLDVEMPHGSGFDLLERISKPNFEVIFTTGFDRYAVTAIKFSALDYLLKPINIEEVIEAVSKAKKRIEGKHTQNNLEHLINNLRHPRDKNNKIPISVVNGFQFVPVNTIEYCEADDDYTYIHLTDNQKLTVSKNIKEFEDILANYDFFRIHHSFLVNRDYIKKYVKGEGGTILTEHGHELPVSRRRKQEFLEWLSSY
ncbi:two component transcriptional regulator, LytTR family [Emticicia oligotrophica DSM 17448]|uniref:Two component transcriptional regulator, LytTR family n=1 Tax=Emticicia oligotrophica (strain DSM 17448 / CIP 109782 / MTCC 6937 / GPTSA100-15) TaxID=929562 RepID=A0ABM5N2F6_EMTOG|nr:LytTR family DNA-binding domain-containing protein [Emticicia oligotrophica]AFK03634.1 two component transcriptional regulator, LytTR family [Emticicia oligotrophica DSM 17448]